MRVGDQLSSLENLIHMKYFVKLILENMHLYLQSLWHKIIRYTYENNAYFTILLLYDAYYTYIY